MRSTVPSTRTRSPQRRLQEGQAIVLIGLLILVLFGMLGLAIDSGRGYVDRRDQQAAVDAAALASGDWYENFRNLTGSTVPQSVKLYQNDLHLYSGSASSTHTIALVGPSNNLQQDTWTYSYTGGYTLTIVATNTLFNGYEFTFTSVHALPLAFMQIFGGPTTVTVNATATAIVGNQRQTPALLTLSTGTCATNLKGSASLTILGDTYSNGTACVDAGLKEAGNCYGAAGSTCSSASYYCYNSTPGFVPYPPPCLAGDTAGAPIVPAPTLPDPGYLANSVSYYSTVQSYNQYNRGTWTEMQPGQYGSFHLSGGSASCAFLDAGVYNWTGGYQSDATGSLLSNELKAPDEERYSAPGTTNLANPQFWNQNGVTCAGDFNVTMPATAAGNGVAEKGSKNKLNQWGVVVTAVRYDTFADPNITPNPCSSSPGCPRESAPSECQLTPGNMTNNGTTGIDVNITRNAPGAQYYNVYLDVYGCDGIPSDFGFVGRFLAPGFRDVGGVPPAGGASPYLGGSPPASPDGSGANPYPNTGSQITLGYTTNQPPSVATIMNLTHLGILYSPVKCYSLARAVGCQPPADEVAPQCFSGCPPPPGTISQQNSPMSLQYAPSSGGDVTNENYCVISPNPGDPNAPCSGAKVTPGAVQFYMPAGSCMSQNAQGATYVFSGLQYNWIVIYQPAGNTCSNTMNGGSATQYIGTIYTPAANWTINGGNIAPLAGQVICSTASVSGGASVGIDFNPNYSPVPPAARLIN
ncbi:hypothetical protein EPN29_05420 [bacterium]|nr:MAG: hypothetical protein EPN29_05420 [bacterium]